MSATARFWSLTYTLAASEFKLRFFGSALGYLWSLMRPLLLFGVLYVVFSHVVRVGERVEHYAVYLLSGIVLWTFFAETTGGALTSLVNRESLLRKVRFPRLTIPLSVALTALFNLGANLVAVIVFCLASGVRPTWRWLELPLLVGILALLATGLGMLLAALYVRFRDLAPIWEVVQQVLFYGSPVLYVASAYPDGFERWLTALPIAAVLTEMRHALIDPAAPSAAEVLGGAVWLLVPLALVAGSFALGAWVFVRASPRLAEQL